MDNSSTVEPNKQAELKLASEKDHEPAGLDIIDKLLPKICESELGKECEVSVHFHVFIPPPRDVLKTKAKSVGAPSPNGK